jgi:drug/metabolite transporter (DMT)-like permease
VHQIPAGFIRFTPALFVCLWATGFIGGKLGLPYAEPLTFLLLRFIAVLMILLPITLLMKAPWPADVRSWGHASVAGLLLHAGYLGGVFSAIDLGLSAGLTALIVGLQPVLTAILATLWFKDKVASRQWLGLGLGVIGVALVVSGNLRLDAKDFTAIGWAVLALASFTLGTLYQKRYCQNLNLLSGTVIQYAVCAALYALLAPLTETMQIRWTGEFVFALLWLVVVLSIFSILLLYVLIRRGAATEVTSLFYMVPPTTAVMAWILFNETLSGWSLIGMLVCVLGVALVVRPSRKPG